MNGIVERVLVINDVEHTRDWLVAQLKELGLHAVGLESREVTSERVLGEKPNLILCGFSGDETIPQEIGYELSLYEQTKGIHFVVTSEHLREDFIIPKSILANLEDRTGKRPPFFKYSVHPDNFSDVFRELLSRLGCILSSVLNSDDSVPKS